MNWDVALVNGITEKTIGCSFRVLNTLGIGILEKACWISSDTRVRTSWIGQPIRNVLSVFICVHLWLIAFLRFPWRTTRTILATMIKSGCATDAHR